METIELVGLVVAALLGAIVAAVLGWSESSEAFNAKKFVNSIIRGAIAAVIEIGAFTYQPTAIVPFFYLLSFGWGAGIDVIGHRVAGAVSK